MEHYPFDDVTPPPAAAQVERETSVETGRSTSSRVRKVATGAAIGVAVLTTGGVAIAATHTGSTSAQGGPGGGGPGGEGGFGGPPGTTSSGTTGTAPSTTGAAPTGRHGFGGAGGFGGPGLADVLHGTFVVPATSGTGTTTEDLQSGKVTAVSATSIVVTSTDKSSGTFVVTTATKVNQGQSKIGDVKVGNTVTVIATDVDKKAVSVEDRSLIATSAGPSGGRGAGPGGGFGGPPTAGTAPTTTGGETT